MCLRGCLETAVYSFYLDQDRASAEIYPQRHDDDQSRKRARQEFAWGATVACLSAKDAGIGRKVLISC